ncbi:MAG: alpha/beta hydrolase [Actinomyces sp.]|nr:alpha/beta hydrolase [Actinomyces sp.]
MFRAFTGNRQIDLQLNRFMGPHLGDTRVASEVVAVAPHLVDGDAVTREFEALARAHEAEGEASLASSCYGLAAFHLPLSDPHKRELIDGFRRCFREGWTSSPIEWLEVPFAGHSLPAAHMGASSGDAPEHPRTLVVFGGFDSYLEEVLGFVSTMGPVPFDIVAFDGPGQGTALLRGVKLMNAWERPVGAVLDHLGIDSCAALGMSFGGYLVMRAAAFEPRIERVVAMDVMYRLLDALTAPLPSPVGAAVGASLRHCPDALVDAVVSRAAHGNLDLSWKLRQASDLTGLDTPHEVLRMLSRFSMEGLFPLIRQDCLLLAGEDDQYVPFRRLQDVERGLVNAASVSTYPFTRAENPGAAQHCQAGDMPLAFGVIREWLEPWAWAPRQ